MEAATTAFNEESGLNLVFSIENRPTTDPGQVSKVIGTNPPAGSLVEPGQSVTIYIGVPDLGGGGG